MGRKSHKQLLKEQKERMLTVGQMRKLLEQFPDDFFVGRIGHFGEFHGLDKFDFHAQTAYITDGFWRTDTREDIDVVEIYSPDIGPEPD